MNRSNVGKWARRIIGGALVALVAAPTGGCNPLNVAAFIFAHDEKVTAAYPLTFGKDSPKKDKEEVVVLVLPHLAPGTNQSFFGKDRELATKLSEVLPDMAKENKDKKKVRVISTKQVDTFKTANTNWKLMNPVDIGQKLGADFVLDIEMNKLRLYQPNTASERIYEGHGEINVTIYEVGTEGGIKDYPLTFNYPKGMPRDGSVMSESQFMKEYIAQLAVEIAEQHVDHTKPSIASGH